MTQEEPYLGNVPVRYDRDPFEFQDIQKDIINSLASFRDGFKIVFFYQNPSYDTILPAALEMLYQATSKLDQGKDRKKVLVYGGTEHGDLTDSYEKTYFGSALFCNELFGYGKLNNEGTVSGENQTYQKGKRTKKERRGSSYIFP